MFYRGFERFLQCAMAPSALHDKPSLSHCFIDYAFEFPNKGVDDFVRLWSMRSFEQFTLCFWMQSSDASGGTPFSYAVPGADNELVITNYNNFTVWIGNEKR